MIQDKCCESKSEGPLLDALSRLNGEVGALGEEFIALSKKLGPVTVESQTGADRSGSDSDTKDKAEAKSAALLRIEDIRKRVGAYRIQVIDLKSCVQV